MVKKAVIAGTGGLIGSTLLDILLHHPDYSEITILVRKKSKYNSQKLTTVIVDFDKLDDYADYITGDSFFCCLGTTLKKTPNLDDYRNIEHDIPLKLAQIAAKNGMKQYHLVSSVGANPDSKHLYTRVKGETELDIKKAGMPGLHIYQPSVLTGKRRERRLAEKMVIRLMSVINPLLLGSLKKYRSIPAQTVAKAMFKKITKRRKGCIRIYI